MKSESSNLSETKKPFYPASVPTVEFNVVDEDVGFTHPNFKFENKKNQANQLRWSNNVSYQ